MFKSLSILLLFALLWLSIVPDGTSVQDPITQAVSDQTRLANHTARDHYRQPAKVLAISEIAPGDTVAELAAGGGYYAALLSRLVGPTGHVYAVDPKRIFEHFPNARDTFQQFTNADPRSNLSYSIQDLDALELPAPVDAIFMILYYHDTIWTGENRAQMLTKIAQSLKPGGKFLVIDHHGPNGSDAKVNQSLHRMDAAQALDEIQAAGFKLILKSDLFSNPDDPRNTNVFSEAWRGRTDRFLYLFERPDDV